MSKEIEHRGTQAELWLVAAIAAVVSVVAFTFYYVRGEILLYGDAVAHINIARRVFDSRNPGPLQLGTVWLPIPHIAQLPFVVNDWMWRTGAGGAIPSMIAYVLGVVGIFRVLRARTTRWTAWVGAGVYGLNPSLLYMQSTPMTESIFLAAMIWSVVYLDKYARGLFPPGYGYGDPASLPPWKALERCGLCLFAAILTRYDGWVLAFLIGMVALWLLVKWKRTMPSEQLIARLTRSTSAFFVLLALTPALWLAHNYAISGRPLDWFNGPYSAKAIAERTTKPTDPPYPGEKSMTVAAQHFLKAARMNMAEGRLEKWVMAAALLGTIVAASHIGHFGALLLFWIPLPFYAYSIAYGSVPVFVPVWWPFSYYNVRYGLELLPMFAVMTALAVWAVSGIRVKRIGAVVSAMLVLMLGVGYWTSWRGDSHHPGGIRAPKPGPLCYREGLTNSRYRVEIENWIASYLRQMPPDARVLMSTGSYVGALQTAGVDLGRSVNESTFIVWDAALSAPAVEHFVVTTSGDPVEEAVRRNPRGLEKVAEFNGPERSAAFYRSSLKLVLEKTK